MKPKRASSAPARAPADVTRWSERSQGDVAAWWTTEYVDKAYSCRHCRAECIFSAADQKYTCEKLQADVNQQRALCEPCWYESLHIAKALASHAHDWAASKAALKSDMAFLANWLWLLELQETYVGHGRPDVARKNMLRKLLGGPSGTGPSTVQAE